MEQLELQPFSPSSVDVLGLVLYFQNTNNIFIDLP